MPPHQSPQQIHPAVRAVQGGLSNPVPVILAGVGAALLAAAAYLPAFDVVGDGRGFDPASLGRNAQVPHPVADSTVGLALLAVAFAASVALHASPRWLQFGRLATWGIAVTVVLTGFSRIKPWIDSQQAAFTVEHPEGNDSHSLELTFGIGLWLFIAGVVAVALATVFIRSFPRAVHTPPPQYPPHPMTAPQQPPHTVFTHQTPHTQHPHPSQTPPSSGDDRNVTVEDDPPSMSIYKPPR